MGFVAPIVVCVVAGPLLMAALVYYLCYLRRAEFAVAARRPYREKAPPSHTLAANGHLEPPYSYPYSTDADLDPDLQDVKVEVVGVPAKERHPRIFY